MSLEATQSLKLHENVVSSGFSIYVTCERKRNFAKHKVVVGTNTERAL